MHRPLADEIRPKSLDEVVGQRHLLAPGGVLRRLIDAGTDANMVFLFWSGQVCFANLSCGGGLKSRGNRRCAASGGRSEPVSRKRRCLWFSKGHKQQCRDGVHPAKVSPANIPVLADNRKYSIFGLPLIEVRTRCLHLNT